MIHSYTWHLNQRVILITTNIIIQTEHMHNTIDVYILFYFFLESDYLLSFNCHGRGEIDRMSCNLDQVSVINSVHISTKIYWSTKLNIVFNVRKWNAKPHRRPSIFFFSCVYHVHCSSIHTKLWYVVFIHLQILPFLSFFCRIASGQTKTTVFTYTCLRVLKCVSLHLMPKNCFATLHVFC